MKANFSTSGFPCGFTDKFIKELKKCLNEQKSFVFVASDFSIHRKTNRYMNLFLKLFKDKNIVFENAVIVDNKISPTKAISLIQEADVVWLSGGDTLLQINDIKNYGLIDCLQQRNGITIGMSAGAINMAKNVVLAKDMDDNIPELSIYDGIGLVDFNVEPHLNTASTEHIKDVKIASQVSPIYGLYDEAFIKSVDGSFDIFGEYRLFK